MCRKAFLSIRLDGEIDKIYKLANLRACQNPSWTFYAVLRLAQKPKLAQKAYRTDHRKYRESGCPKVPSTLAHKRMFFAREIKPDLRPLFFTYSEDHRFF